MDGPGLSVEPGDPRPSSAADGGFHRALGRVAALWLVAEHDELCLVGAGVRRRARDPAGGPEGGNGTPPCLFAEGLSTDSEMD